MTYFKPKERVESLKNTRNTSGDNGESITRNHIASRPYTRMRKFTAGNSDDVQLLYHLFVLLKTRRPLPLSSAGAALKIKLPIDGENISSSLWWYL
jgi:hypothetical protein